MTFYDKLLAVFGLSAALLVIAVDLRTEENFSNYYDLGRARTIV